jgi:uncharacterized repeat protein (TIGR01451 family)
MKRSLGLAAMLAIAGTLVVSSSASAHRWPDTCLTNGINLAINKNLQVVRPGDNLHYELWVDNTRLNPCDITEAALKIWLPTAAGVPSTTSITLATNKTFIGGFPFTKIAETDWTVQINPDVTHVEVQAGVSGTLHDVDVDSSFADILKTLSTEVTRPQLDIDKTGSLTSGQAPQTVTYTYAVTNTSQTPVPMDQVGVDDDLCPNVSPSPTGDNGDGLLTNGETWYFTCTATYTTPGTYINTAQACAISKVDNRPVCSPKDTWTVTITPPPPPPPPQSSVLPAQTTQAPCVLRTQSRLRVRAGQLNTIRVTARADGPVVGKRVTVRLPGNQRASATTNSRGVATIRVRPRRSGTARITAPECSTVRVSVASPRRTQAPRVPRVTG